MYPQPFTMDFPLDRTARPHRIIYSLLFRFAPLPTDPPESITELVVSLDRNGNLATTGAMIEPRDRTKRIIDLRAGDQLLVDAKWRTITRVSAFRDNWLTAEWAAEKAKQPRGDGYLYRPAAK